MGLNVANDSNQLAAFAVCLTTAPICIIATFLRFLSTRRAHRKAGWEDWFALLSLIFFLIYVSLMISLLVVLDGRNLVHERVPAETIVLATKIGYVMSAQFCPQQTFAKFSLLFLYYRIFSSVKSFRISLWVVGAVQLAWGIATYVVHYFTCTPVSKMWNPRLPGTCINHDAFLVGGESINSFLDFVLVGLAVWMVQSLQMKTETKLKLSLLFALGGLAGVLGFVKIGEAYSGNYASLLDAVFGLSQQAISIICCCAPIYRALVPQLGFYHSIKSFSSRVFVRSKQQNSYPSSEKHSQDSREAVHHQEEKMEHGPISEVAARV
ncbi:hypothetical protein ED733_000825 [Metarhizium rileyi]|uniref:Rhodopsin domain-containing protein n=1 Tax=Metarhizium rileyi (strain RCEF 4871) TaxID=1649241 RepID=A0A5C6GBU0_METRR|nr:hypothetical protein ED733_000825 [Metarhizium rileyi]